MGSKIKVNQMSKDHTSRPQIVGTAVKLLYISLGIGALGFILFAFSYPYPSSRMAIFSILFFVFVIIGPMWLFIYKIDKGRNWARITVLVIFILSVVCYLPSITEILRRYPINTILGIVQLIVQAVAQFFLFQKPSSEWFKAKKMTGYALPSNFQGTSQGKGQFKSLKMVGYFFLVFIIVGVLMGILEVLLGFWGYRFSHHYQLFSRILIPLFAGIYYVRKMIQSGKFDG